MLLPRRARRAAISAHARARSKVLTRPPTARAPQEELYDDGPQEGRAGQGEAQSERQAEVATCAYRETEEEGILNYDYRPYREKKKKNISLMCATLR